MRRKAAGLLIASLTCAWGWSHVSATAQTGQPGRIVGVVTKVETSSLTLHADAGADVAIHVADNVIVLRLPPGATDLKSAAKISVSDITVGDRILVRGRLSEDGKSAVAQAIMLMTKADLANAQETERLDWQKRGIVGTVTAVDPEKGEITIALPAGSGPASARTQTITLASNVIPQRYAPDSVKFSDAKASSLDAIKTGDQVRALGTKAEDGSFRAEKLVSGTFRNFAVTVLSLNVEDRTITVKDTASGQNMLVRTNADSALRRLPPDAARMLAKPSTANENDTEQLIESAPGLPLGEIKTGEPLIVLSTEGVKPSEVTAILVLAGVESVLAARPKGNEQVVIGPWSLGKSGVEDAP